MFVKKASLVLGIVTDQDVNLFECVKWRVVTPFSFLRLFDVVSAETRNKNCLTVFIHFI